MKIILRKLGVATCVVIVLAKRVSDAPFLLEELGSQERRNSYLQNVTVGLMQFSSNLAQNLIRIGSSWDTLITMHPSHIASISSG
ncbi:hypothetical protein HN51_032501 [Arachis hypogaea]